MAELTIDQQRAVALAKAKAAAAAARNKNLEAEVGANAPTTVMEKTQAPSILSEGMQGGLEQMHQIAPTTRFMPMVVGGVMGAAKNLAQTGAAAYDYFAGTDSAKTIEENVPELKSNDATVNFGQQAVAAGVGAAGPQKFIKGGQALTQLPRILANTAKFVAVNAGGVAAMDDDVNPLVTGENAELGNYAAWADLGTDRNGTYSEELVKNKLELLLEGAALSKTFQVVGKGISATTKFLTEDVIGGLTNWKSLPVAKQKALEEYISRVKNMDPQDTPAQRSAKLQDLADVIDRNAEVDIASPAPGIDGVKYNRTTSGALLADPSTTPAEKARAVGTQAHVLAGSAPETEAVLGAPSLALEKATDQANVAFGGKAASEQTRKAILKSGERDVANYTDEVARQEQGLATANKDVQAVLKNDEFLGKTISGPEERGIDLSLGEKVNNTADRIVIKHNNAKDKLIEESNTLYKAVEESSAPADMDSWRAARKQVDEFIPNDIKTLMDEVEVEGTYGALKTKVLPELNAHIDELMEANPKSRIARKLITLRDNINKDQMAHLTEHGNDVTANAAKKANENFVENVAPFKQGTSEELTKIDKTLSRKYPDDARVDSRKTLKGTLDDPEQADHTRRIFELVDNDKDKADYVLGSVAEEISDTVASKGVDALDMVTVAKKLRQHLPLLSKDQRVRAEKFLNDVETRRGDIEGMKKILKQTTDETTKARDTIMNKELGNFFDKQGLPNLNPEQVFTKYFKDQDGANQIRQLMNRAKSESPELVKGLKAVYAKYYKAKIFRGGEGAVGEKNIDEKMRGLIDTDQDQLVEFGKILHEDDPEVLALFDKLSKDAASNAASTGGVGKIPFSPSSEGDKQARGTIDFLITQTFGALNRWGARLRSATGRVIASQSSAQQTQAAKDFVMSNPKEAAKLIRELAESEGKKLTPEFRKRVYQHMVRNAQWAASDEEEFVNDKDLKEQTEEVIKKK